MTSAVVESNMAENVEDDILVTAHEYVYTLATESENVKLTLSVELIFAEPVNTGGIGVTL